MIGRLDMGGGEARTAWGRLCLPRFVVVSGWSCTGGIYIVDVPELVVGGDKKEGSVEVHLGM